MSALEVKFPRSLLLAQLMRHQCIDFYFFFVACRLLLHVEGLDNLAKIKKKKKKICRVQGKLTAKFPSFAASSFFRLFVCM